MTDIIIYEVMTGIRRLTRTSLTLQQVIAGKMQLNVTDAECVDFLKEMGPLTAGELSRVTRLTTGAVTSVIDRLEKAGYVVREKDPSDRRKVIVKVNESRQGPQKDYALMASDVYTLLSSYKTEELLLLKKFTDELTTIFLNHANNENENNN